MRDEEISRVLDFIKQSGTVQYDEAMIEAMEKHAIQAVSYTHLDVYKRQAQQRLHHRTFILKIQIKGALGHLGPAGDILYAGFCGTSLHKQIIGCLQQCPALPRM